MRKTVSAAFAAFALIAAATGDVPARAGTSVEIRMVAAGPDAVPQGAPFRYRIEVTNPEIEAATVALDLSLEQAWIGGRTIAFDRVVRSIGGLSTWVVRGRVVSSQWFARTGRYRVILRSGSEEFRLPFVVTRPTVRVPRFRDVTAAVGLTAEHAATPGCDNLASGAAWGDVDRDGDLDLYMPQQEDPSRLWIQDDGAFVDDAVIRGVTNDGAIGIGAVFADYDNDNDLDLYVVNDGPNRLYRNDGTGSFDDVSLTSGTAEAGPGSSASWGDYDADGDLDLYVTNWARCGDQPWIYADDTLFRNEGDGTFTDVTYLLESVASTNGAGFQASWVDVDRDDDLDLYLGNDFVGPSPTPNVLWSNEGESADGWIFSNESVSSGAALSINTMGIGVGDYDRDLDFDLALSNIRSAALLRNRGDGTFEERATYARIERSMQHALQPVVSWGVDFQDLNNDGWEDLFFTAGSIVDAYPGPQPDLLFANARNGRFLDLSAPSGAASPRPGRGVAFADYDRDGRVDMFVVNQAGRPQLFRNVTSRKDAHWLEVRLRGHESNSQGCGAVLIARIGTTAKLMREVSCGSTSLASGSDATVHFGLGKAARIGRLTIRWPSGRVQVVGVPEVDRVIRVVEPVG